MRTPADAAAVVGATDMRSARRGLVHARDAASRVTIASADRGRSRRSWLPALALSALIAGPVLALPRSEHEPLAFVPVPDLGASVDRRTADPDGVVPLPSMRLAPVRHATR